MASRSPQAPTGVTLPGITYGRGRYVAVGAAETILVSEDGLGWTAAPQGSVGGMRGVTWGDGLLLALRSPDGESWTAQGRLSFFGRSVPGEWFSATPYLHPRGSEVGDLLRLTERTPAGYFCLPRSGWSAIGLASGPFAPYGRSR